MTEKNNIKYQSCDLSIKKKSLSAISFFLAFGLLLFSLVATKDIAHHVTAGLKLCANTVISSVFPFLILTDIISHTSGLEQIKALRSLFEKLFKANGYAIGAFVIGITCGFPIGVKYATEMYKSKKITKEECCRLIGFVNNTGPAFIVSGIGLGMRGNMRDGVIIYVSMVLSAIVVGILFGLGKTYKNTNLNYTKDNYDFSSSVKNAAQNTLSICGFVVLFSVICGILCDFVKNRTVLSIILPFIEVTNASVILANDAVMGESVSLIATSFAVSFSGISVHLQASAFLRNTDISMRKYYLMKLLQGFFSAAITTLILFFYK